MKLNKFEFGVILLTVVLISVTVGYLMARVPVSGTFEISTQIQQVIPAPPSPEETAIPTAVVDPEELSPVEADTGPVNINTADSARLQRLPGVGPALAQRIIEEREANGDFDAVEALTRVKGIGLKMVENFQGLAVV